MSTTCVKGISPSSCKGWRRRAQQYMAAQQYYQDMVTAEGYNDVIEDRAQIQSALEQQAKDVAEFKNAQEKPKPKPNIPQLDIIGQGDITQNQLHKLSGDVVEQVSLEIAVEKLGYEPIPYDQPLHGVDIFCKKDGKIVAIESKGRAEPNATEGLKRSVHGDRQCSDTWMERKFESMKTEGSTAHTDTNLQIVEAIEAQGGIESVDTLLVHHNPHTMNIFVHEKVDSKAEQWEPVALLEFDQNAVEKP